MRSVVCLGYCLPGLQGWVMKPQNTRRPGQAVYEPGMVITCEPGLYVAEEGIGIRLENDILVTEGAPEDLVGDRLLNIEEIEDLMKR